MKKDYFKDSVKNQFKQEGSSIYSNNFEFISKEMNNSRSELIQQVKLNNLRKGGFYFMFYDLDGKSSKMEKFNPVLLIDWFDMNNTRMVYAVSINFIPVSIRTVFFNNLLNFNLDVIEENNKLPFDKEKELEAINFTNIYKLLSTIGFEWSIRKFDIKKINKLYKVSTKSLQQFIIMSTAKFTGVDDGKLIEIWRKKIKEKEERHKKIINEILNNYDNMEKQLTNTYMDLDKKNDNLQESLKIIKTMF